MRTAERSRRLPLGRLVALWLLALISLFYLLAPPGWMLISSFSPLAELHSKPPHWIPHRPTLEHYETLFQTPGANALALKQNPQVQAFPRSFANSLVIALATTLICVAFGAISAYSLSRFIKRERQRWILLGLLATRMVPVVSILIPIYFALQRLGMLNTLTGLIVVWKGTSATFRWSSRKPPRSTAALRSAPSGASCCRCRRTGCLRRPRSCSSRSGRTSSSG